VSFEIDALTISLLFASLAVYSWKLLGHLVPAKLTGDKFRRTTDAITIALLAALVGVQGFTLSGEVVFDERVLALGVAALLLVLRAPFILVVIVAAVVAGLLRL
jgi:hypothetical protein